MNYQDHIEREAQRERADKIDRHEYEAALSARCSRQFAIDHIYQAMGSFRIARVGGDTELIEDALTEMEIALRMFEQSEP